MARRDRTILVVDDDEDIRETVRWVLESSGYVVKTAVDGNDAWSKLHSNGQVSLILLDLMMPGMDGGRFLTLLRNSRHDKVPVVVISGHHATPETAQELGAEGWLVKPVELDDLLESVRKFAAG